jgi:hypothetical protein
MFEASVWERLQPAADFRQEESVRRQEKQEIPVADFCPEESVRRQEKQENPAADDRPVFFLAKWVGREGSQESFRDQFLSFFFFWTFPFLDCTLFWVGDKLLEKIPWTSIESLADFSFGIFKLPSTYGWYGKRLYWNIFIRCSY